MDVICDKKYKYKIEKEEVIRERYNTVPKLGSKKNQKLVLKYLALLVSLTLFIGLKVLKYS